MASVQAGKNVAIGSSASPGKDFDTAPHVVRKDVDAFLASLVTVHDRIVNILEREKEKKKKKKRERERPKKNVLTSFQLDSVVMF